MNQVVKTGSGIKPSITLLASVLVITGLLLTTLSWWWLLITALGAVLPGLCRELGWLRDRDEYQLHAIRRAGYHAYLACMAVGLMLLAWLRATEAERDRVQDVGSAQDLAMLMVCLAWLTWLFSWLTSYWGAQRAASRVLLLFGLIWLAFAVLSNIGDEWNGLATLGMQMLLALPFLALSYLTLRKPRLTGVILILLSIGFGWMFGVWRYNHATFLRQGPVLVLFIGPLLASGISLLGPPTKDEE